MDIVVRTNISNEYKNIEIIINTPEKNEEINLIENYLLSKMNSSIRHLVGMQDNNIFILDISDITTIYSENKINYCKTKDRKIYKIKETLYYLEETLPCNQFIRISNSVIINIDNIECFDTSIIGKLIVKFKDGSKEYVSRRRISQIMKFLNKL